MAYETTQVRAPQPPKSGQRLTVTSETFTDGGTIPRECAFGGCGGQNTSPHLAWSGAPPETKSFAVTCFDPDAPTGSGYWHWAAWNIPADWTRLDAGVQGRTAGRNDYGQPGYGGPCPPPGDGEHRYVFTVYALDVETLEGINADTSGASVIFTMRGHVLATGTITGRFGMS